MATPRKSGTNEGAGIGGGKEGAAKTGTGGRARAAANATEPEAAAANRAGPAAEAAGAPTGRKSAARTGAAKTAGAAKQAGAGAGPGKRGAKAAQGPDLRTDLRGFVGEHPQGWGHEEWTGLLDRLRDRGHDVSDTDSIGWQLERERLEQKLSQVPGVGAQRVKTLVERFGTIWNLRHADPGEVAQAANIPQSLAERITGALH